MTTNLIEALEKAEGPSRELMIDGIGIIYCSGEDKTIEWTESAALRAMGDDDEG